MKFRKRWRKCFLLFLLLFTVLGAGGTVSAKTAKGSWVSTEDGTKYQYKNGTYAKSTWLTIKGKKYYVNKKGVRLEHKWLKKGKNYYYFLSSGAMAKNRWIGKYYVGANGARKKNCKIGDQYVDSKGRKITAKYIFVGDCRTVGMDWAIDDSRSTFIGKVSMGYTWLKSVAYYQLKSSLSKNPDVKVIMAFGLNDLYNQDNYITFYKQLVKQFPDTEFYFMALNPVDESKAAANGYNTSVVNNTEVQKFNQALKKAFPSRYLDTYSYLMKTGFSASDGIHYSSATYQTLYDYIILKTN